MQQHAGTEFVGRDRELRELLDALDTAVSGRGRLVLIGGEPGVGKSRLADELATRARERGHVVLLGRGWEDAGAPPYWPWVQALRSYLRGAEPLEVRRQLGPGASDIAQMLPELRGLFPDLMPPETEGEWARFQLFDSTVTFLRRASAVSPLVVIVDDLQAADTPSILFLRFLATQLSDMAVLIVATYRDIELAPGDPLTSAIAELAREPVARIVALGGLKPIDVGQFMGATGLVLNERLVSAVWRETKGNPLFVGEAVRLLSTEGQLSDVVDLPSFRVAVPPSVRAVIARRIGHLSDLTSRVLTNGAALGPEFSLEVLGKLEAVDADPLDLVDDAVQAGLLVPVGGVLGRVRFSHDLVRETLYDELSPSRRVRLHRRIAQVLEDLYATSIDAHLAELAFHFVAAVQGGDPAGAGHEDGAGLRKAIDYATRAGDQAARSLAYEEAARLYRMALAVMELTDARDDSARTEMLLALGDVAARAGDFDDARATFLRAADIARRTGNANHLGRAVLGRGGRHPWARPGDDDRLIPLLRDALVMLGGADESLRVRLLTRLACAWRSTPERRNDSDMLTRQAVDVARELEDPTTLTYALAGRFWATWWPENPEERESIAQEMIVIADAVGDGERIVDAHLMLFLSQTELGRIAEGRSELATISRLIEELGQPAQLWLGTAPRIEMALLEGDLGLAEDLIEHGIPAGFRITPARDDVSAIRMQRFLLRRAQGRVGEVEADMRAATAEFPWYPMHRAALACVLADLERPDEARSVLADISSDAFRAVYPDNEWFLGICLVSDAIAILGDAVSADVLYQRLVPYAGRHAIGHAEGSVGAVDRYLGLLAATMGDLDRAERHFRDAIALNDQMGARPWTALSQADLARSLSHRDAPGDRERASALARAAKETARALGMALEHRLDDLLGDKTLDEAGVPIPPAPRDSGSFHREGEYWTIGFEGDTIRIRDMKGMYYLARLLESAGRELHALDLAGGGRSSTGAVSTVDAALTSDGLGDVGPALDPEAKVAYRERLNELQLELDEATSWNDPERVARTQAEIDAIAHELAAAMGLGGRDRRAVSAAERARVSVTRALRAAMARIADQSPTLGSHFEATVRTGTFCSYHPDPRAPIRWQS